MIRTKVVVQNKLGIHTRAGAKLVDTAKRFASKIEMVRQDRIADCKSIMGVITLGAQKDDELDLIIDGEDENDALDAINKLMDDKFGED